MAFLEEKRDDIVIRLVRYMQEQAVLRIRSAFFRVKRDQRELIKVCQRNFRKYIALRDWGWFVMNQKTRPMIGRANPEEELRLLALKANEKYGAYDQQLKTKSLLLENENIKQETKALLKQPEKEQGNMSEHHEKQAKMNSQKADLEGQLLVSQEILIVKEEERQMATGDKKVLEQEIISVKKDIEDIDMAIQKLKQEKANQDHTI